MNEVDLLKEFRTEVPAQQDVRKEKERLLAKIEHENAATASGVADRDVTTARNARRRPVVRLRTGLALAGALAAVAAAAVVVPQLGGRESVSPPIVALPEASPSSAVKVLENAALVAARTNPAEIRPGQWFYMKEAQHDMGPDFETWNRMDGRRSAIREGGKLRVGPPEKGPTHSGKTQQEVEALPTDPDELLAHFRSLDKLRPLLSLCQPNCPEGTEKDVDVFGTIGWYLKFGPMIPADTTAGLYRALAKIPNVKVEENAVDGAGRQGVGVVLDLGRAGKSTLILDAGDFHFLGVKNEVDGRTMAMSVLASAMVDKPGDTS
ncbi:CU044_5270 family protein [Nonomuraea endophytica]|uniref:CU044_5270 family protein n=1 Tax=Nonomuraea endophytica TaxID=714136 RepID=UPI0037C58079